MSQLVVQVYRDGVFDHEYNVRSETSKTPATIDWMTKNADKGVTFRFTEDGRPIAHRPIKKGLRP